jgi:hypothetical protein
MTEAENFFLQHDKAVARYILQHERKPEPMATTYKYTVELSEPMYPRFLADCMQMQGNLNRSLLSVTDLQRSDHVYGATYQVRDEQEAEPTMTLRKDPEASVTLQFSEPLPCTTEDCPNAATIGNASYDPRQNAWVLFPMCKSCLRGLMRKYDVQESEA